MMTEPEKEQGGQIWRLFVKRHWNMLAVFVVAAIIAVIGAVLLFLWFVGDAQATGLIPQTLNLLTMDYLITFLLYALLWEAVVIGIPVIVFVASVYFFWWKRLPVEERTEYRQGHLFGKRSRGRDGGGAVSFLINIGFIIKVYVDGNWNVPFATWTVDYLVYSYLTVIIWMAVIFGIPLAIGGLWWLHREMKKNL